MFLIQKQKWKNGNKNLGLLDTSGTDLALALGLKVYTPKLKVKKYLNKLIVNWGCSYIPWLEDDNVRVNKPSKVKNSSNKITAFELMNEAGVRIVPFTTIRDVAKAWLPSKVVCRTIVNGSSGKGIVIAINEEGLVNAPLYTQYIKKKWEYRVHVAFSKVIHIQQKRRLTQEQLESRGIINRNKYIRNLENGYIFSTDLDHDCSEETTSLIGYDLKRWSLQAIKSLDLDFGAVDLLVTKDGDVRVLEVNSAPGLEGVTLSKYISHFKEVLGVV